jgi:hypothetical protein
VPYSDGIGFEPVQSVSEKPMTAGAGGHLQGKVMTAAVSMHIFGRCMQGQPKGFRQGLDEIPVGGRGVGAELMIKMEDGDPADAAEVPQRDQNMEEGHRVGPAGYGYEE